MIDLPYPINLISFLLPSPIDLLCISYPSLIHLLSISYPSPIHLLSIFYPSPIQLLSTSYQYLTKREILAQWLLTFTDSRVAIPSKNLQNLQPSEHKSPWTTLTIQWYETYLFIDSKREISIEKHNNQQWWPTNLLTDRTESRDAITSKNLCYCSTNRHWQIRKYPYMLHLSPKVMV